MTFLYSQITPHSTQLPSVWFLQSICIPFSFLQLDTTKTSDNKSTFLHVVAKTATTNMPDAISFREEIPTVPKADKMSLIMLGEDRQDLEQKLQNLSASVASLGADASSQYPEDRFNEAMVSFKTEAADKLGHLKTLFAETAEEFNKTALYFGEDPTAAESDKFFGIFSVFTTKFAVSI